MSQVFGKLTAAYLKQEAVYGVAPAGNFDQMAYYTSTLGAPNTLEENDVLSVDEVWDPEDPEEGLTNHSGQLSVPLCLSQLGRWLSQLMGAPVTTDDTGGNYTHVWKSGAEQLPSAFLEMKMAAGRFHHHPGLMVNGFSLATQRQSGYGQVSLDCLGQDEILAAVSVAGVPTQTVLTQVPTFSGSILIDDVAVASLTEGSINFTNNMTPKDTLREDGLQSGYDRGKPMFTGSLTGRYENSTLYEMGRDRTAFGLEFKWAKSATLSLSMKAGRCFMPKPTVSVNGPGGVDVPYAFEAKKDPAEADKRALVVTLKNQIAAY